MLLAFTGFFFEKFIHKEFTFFKKNVEKMKKNENFGNFWFKRKTGKCQQHETNMILCLLHATDIYQFFFEKFIHKEFTFFKKNVEKMKKNKHFGNFWFKKKTGKCQQQKTNMILCLETNMILCLLHATGIYQFFVEKIIHKEFTFFKKNVKKMKILVIFGSKKKTGKCQQHETNMILCLLHATGNFQFFFEKIIHKEFTFFKKNVKKRKKKEDFGNFWFKKKNW